jgi:hypothetical protein
LWSWMARQDQDFAISDLREHFDQLEGALYNQSADCDMATILSKIKKTVKGLKPDGHRATVLAPLYPR